jgi:hypothetical protein
MELHKLTLKEIITLVVLFIIGYGFTMTQKYYLPSTVRPFTFLLAVLAIYLFSFWLIRPRRPLALANTLALVFGLIVLALIIVQDIILMHYFSWRTLIVFFGTVLIPYLAGYIFERLKA